jgi:hypothetical protein
MGYETPEAQWLNKNPLKELIQEIILSSESKTKEYINHACTEKIFKLYIKDTMAYKPIIWKILNLELWMRKYFQSKTIIHDKK